MARARNRFACKLLRLVNHNSHAKVSPTNMVARKARS